MILHAFGTENAEWAMPDSHGPTVNCLCGFRGSPACNQPSNGQGNSGSCSARYLASYRQSYGQSCEDGSSDRNRQSDP
jgi:hypothetical protein